MANKKKLGKIRKHQCSRIKQIPGSLHYARRQNEQRNHQQNQPSSNGNAPTPQSMAESRNIDTTQNTNIHHYGTNNTNICTRSTCPQPNTTAANRSCPNQNDKASNKVPSTPHKGIQHRTSEKNGSILNLLNTYKNNA